MTAYPQATLLRAWFRESACLTLQCLQFRVGLWRMYERMVGLPVGFLNRRNRRAGMAGSTDRQWAFDKSLWVPLADGVT
ncbi:MAG: hypothetical protein CMJ70_13970 [Planctomycetaceae bacterium]|jgi:hypothetical protein|nr:hypothetical protein [Planctomycetaceae bacterium]